MQKAAPNAEKSYTLMTFVGTGQRHMTPYTWQDQHCETEHFAEALLQFLPINKVLFFVTPEAKNSDNKNFEAAKAAVESAHVAYEAIEIPNGSQPEEYWQIFDKLTQHAGSDEIVFDITHGFRSLPMLGFLACVYLKALGKNEIAYLLYGNYEARKANGGNAPVYDLTPFLSLLDWIEGANQLVETGSSYRLAKLMTQIQSNAYRQRDKSSQMVLPQELGRAAKMLESISATLLLAQPESLHTYIQKLQAKLPEVAEESKTWARPVTGLLQRIEETYAPFQENTLASQRALIFWYLEHGHYTQAITLGREWLVSYMCQHLLDTPFPKKDERSRIERAIGYWTLSDENRATQEPPTETAQAVCAQPAFALFIKIWMRLSTYRNTIAHCGMGREENQDTLKLARSIGEALKDLEQLTV